MHRDGGSRRQHRTRPGTQESGGPTGHRVADVLAGNEDPRPEFAPSPVGKGPPEPFPTEAARDFGASEHTGT